MGLYREGGMPKGSSDDPGGGGREILSLKRGRLGHHKGEKLLGKKENKQKGKIPSGKRGA